MASKLIQGNDLSRQSDQILECLLDIARTAKRERSKLKSSYTSWSEDSKKTVESMMKIREKIIRHNSNSNIASLTGTSTAIVGSVLSIVGVALAVPSGGLSLFLTAGGAGTLVTGWAVSVGSKITKQVLSKQLYEEAKQIFSENMSSVQLLEEQTAIYFDILDNFKTEIDKLCGDHFVLEFIEEELKEKDVLKDFELEDDVRCNLSPTSIQAENLKPRDVKHKGVTLFERLVELIGLIKEDPFLTQLANRLLRSLIEAKQLTLNADWSIIGIANVGDLRLSLNNMNTSFRVAAGVMNAVFIALGIVDIVLLSVDQHNGAISNESEEILRVAEDLRKCREEVIQKMADTFGWKV